jgi:hypothetical protein
MMAMGITMRVKTKMRRVRRMRKTKKVMAKTTHGGGGRIMILGNGIGSPGASDGKIGKRVTGAARIRSAKTTSLPATSSAESVRHPALKVRVGMLILNILRLLLRLSRPLRRRGKEKGGDARRRKGGDDHKICRDLVGLAREGPRGVPRRNVKGPARNRASSSARSILNSVLHMSGGGVPDHDRDERVHGSSDLGLLGDPLPVLIDHVHEPDLRHSHVTHRPVQCPHLWRRWRRWGNGIQGRRPTRLKLLRERGGWLRGIVCPLGPMVCS